MSKAKSRKPRGKKEYVTSSEVERKTEEARTCNNLSNKLFFSI
jgi:hypothetical protein